VVTCASENVWPRQFEHKHPSANVEGGWSVEEGERRVVEQKGTVCSPENGSLSKRLGARRAKKNAAEASGNKLVTGRYSNTSDQKTTSSKKTLTGLVTRPGDRSQKWGGRYVQMLDKMTYKKDWCESASQKSPFIFQQCRLSPNLTKVDSRISVNR